MGSRFVRPDIAVLKLSNGDTLTVKKRLNSGEQRAAYARMYLAGADGTVKANPLAIGLSRITAYLLDWSLTDDDGNLVVIRNQPVDAVVGALDSLDSESFVEISEAITAHEEAMQAERNAEKNGQAGESKSSTTSPLLVDAAGA